MKNLLSYKMYCKERNLRECEGNNLNKFFEELNEYKSILKDIKDSLKVADNDYERGRLSMFNKMVPLWVFASLHSELTELINKEF